MTDKPTIVALDQLRAEAVPRVVEMLETLLEKAKEGEIRSVGWCALFRDPEDNGPGRAWSYQTEDPYQRVELLGLTHILQSRLEHDILMEARRLKDEDAEEPADADDVDGNEPDPEAT